MGLFRVTLRNIKDPVIFFFFNDTATTEIYTLSLHDALPICAGRRRADDDGRGGTPRSGRRGRVPVVVGGSDRKSTRLNSSHVAISYAVFCLKKKTRASPPGVIWSRRLTRSIARRSLALRPFFFNDTATTEIYTLSLHDALPISSWSAAVSRLVSKPAPRTAAYRSTVRSLGSRRSEEHTSELQSRGHLVCRL